MRKNGFKKDLLALPPREFFHVYIINNYISNHTISLVQFGINLHLWVFLAEAARAISAF